jgi:hypothetical protein
MGKSTLRNCCRTDNACKGSFTRRPSISWELYQPFFSNRSLGGKSITFHLKWNPCWMLSKKTFFSSWFCFCRHWQWSLQSSFSWTTNSNEYKSQKNFYLTSLIYLRLVEKPRIKNHENKKKIFHFLSTEVVSSIFVISAKSPRSWEHNVHEFLRNLLLIWSQSNIREKRLDEIVKNFNKMREVNDRVPV